MKKYQQLNNLTGWLVFLVAAATYILTAEASASLWDCGEFIATGFKLEVGHPPGAPLFMLISRFASLFAGTNVEMAARMVNYYSALASAFTILFLFWTITHIARKIVIKGNSENLSLSDTVIILGSGAVGALAYTFSDSFWFSAVEGEVYASSSLFTALVFWAILKWENVADEKYSNRWIILIAYLMGLSIGVHLLNLLAIPAIVMVYYFRKFKVTMRGTAIALSISVVILAFVMYGIIQGVVKVASWFELFFVNGFGLPFNSGILFYSLLILGLLVYGIHYSLKKHKVILNTALCAIAMILIGYMSFASIVIRANTDTPINENKPDNVFGLLSYLNREQYGDRPLFVGQYYNAPMIEVKDKSPIYTPLNGKYEVTGSSYEVVWDERFLTFFPRMYSTDPNHIEIYKSWGSVKGNPVDVQNDDGKTQTLYVPTFGENLKFFFKYQIGYMYMRYFMWNFAGRQNDEQGSGGILKGNWISGIGFIDEMRLGSQSNIPPSLKDVPSRNVYYFLPFILGILGLIYLLDRSKRDFFVTVLLFFMTGLAIVLYLNQTPLQPRERDYAYVGSFYAFAIWIGLGALAIFKWIKHDKTQLSRAIATVLICLLLVPGIMAKENWDDHDRSGRYTTRSYAYNYLMSCAPNAILFTYGDNDTFPLWYLQEVEGVRTDVRVVNTMLLNTDWYINQMKKKAYNSEPLPITLTYDKYISGKRSRVYIIEQIKDETEIRKALDFVASDDPRTKTIQGYNDRIEYIPCKNLIIDVDKAQVIKNGTVAKQDSNLIEPQVKFALKGRSIDKSQLITLDIIANNKWQRPIYFVAVGSEGTCGLDEFLQLDGFAYRLVPIKTKFSNTLDCGRVNTNTMYNNITKVFNYGRMDAPDVYLDHFHERTINVMRYRNVFARLAKELILENKKDSAITILDKCMQLVPSKKIHDDLYTIPLIEGYLAAGDIVKGTKYLTEYYNTCTSELNYYMSFRPDFRNLINYDISYNFEALRQMGELARGFKLPLEADIKKNMEEYSRLYNTKNE